jgi:hypothetical protein
VTARVARWIEQTAPEMDAASKAIFLPGGKASRPFFATSAWRTPCAPSRRTGRAGFYEGDVAKKLARLGGFFTERDLAAQGAYWGEPLRGTYRGVTICETPAPTQGFSVLEMLNLIEPLELGPFLGPDHVHLLVQAKQIAYHDRDRWLGDPRFTQVPTERLISKSYADERRNLIDRKRALPWDKVPSHGSLTGDTVYVAAVDAQGNAASLIFSLYGVFGSCVTSAETGVVLQNRGAYFSLDPKHPNRLEPGKVPLHTLIASLAFRDDKLWAVLGCMGADGQPQIHLQTYVAMIDYGRDIQQALAGPRWLSGRFGLGEARDTLHIEARFPRETIDELERRGPPGGSLGRDQRARGPRPRHYAGRAEPACWPAASTQEATAPRQASRNARIPRGAADRRGDREGRAGRPARRGPPARSRRRCACSRGDAARLPHPEERRLRSARSRGAERKAHAPQGKDRAAQRLPVFSYSEIDFFRSAYSAQLKKHSLSSWPRCSLALATLPTIR